MRTFAKHVLQSSRNAVLTILLATVALAGLAGSARSAAAQANAGGARPNPADVEIHVLPVQGNVYMLVGAGGNITVQAGDDGVLLVDAGLAGTSDKVYAAIQSISTKPIRYIIDTHVHADHVGGNEALAKLGNTIAGGNVVGDIGASAGNQATVIAAQEVLDRMSMADGKQPAMPQAA